MKTAIKKFKYAFALLAAVAAVVLCLVACGKGASEDVKQDEGDGKKPVVETVVGISLDTTNAVTVYTLGGAPFDASGVALVKHLEGGGTKKALVTSDMITAPDMTTRGKKTVKVTFGEFSAEYDITVRELKTFEIDTKGAKTTFEVGDAFSSDGLVVSASYTDFEGTETIDAGVGGYSLTAPDMTTPGMKSVTVSYCGIERTYSIAVRCAPVLYSASLVVGDGKLKVQAVGKAEGYAQSPRFEIDLQKLMSDDYIRDIPVVADFAEDGAFTVTAEIDASKLERMTDVKDVGYLVHVLIDGVPYDLVDTQTDVSSVQSFDGAFYGLKSEKCFSDNESKFVVLRAAATEELLVRKVLTVQSAKLETRDGALCIAVRGDVSGLTLDGASVRLVEKDNWDNVISLKTDVVIEGETFTAFAAIPDGDSRIHVGSVMFTRFIVPGVIDENDGAADKELHDLPGGVKTETVEFGNGKYTIKQESLYDQKQLVTLLYERDAAEYAVTDVTLSVEGGKLYYVVSGTFTGSSDDWNPVMDMQRTYDAWDKFNMPTAATATFGEGTFTIKQEISNFDFDVDKDRPYITHLYVCGVMGDICDVEGFTDASVRFEKDGKQYEYVLYADNLFAPDNTHSYICLKVNAAA